MVPDFVKSRLACKTVSASDKVTYSLTSQQSCVEVTRRATRDCRWAAGLNNNVDQLVLNGDVIAYQMFNGRWSGWYVTGVNDIDWKFNVAGRTCSVAYQANSMHRFWSYFYDHTHKYILCRDPMVVATPGLPASPRLPVFLRPVAPQPIAVVPPLYIRTC